MTKNVSTLPNRCEVLVIGAGPAGSAAARILAQAGVDVVLIDQQPQGRDKICGDGLIPDSHAALARLGLLERVMADAEPVSYVRFVGPNGKSIDVPGNLAVLPRKLLDNILCQGAQDAGAHFFAPVRFEKPLLDNKGCVIGAMVKTGDHEQTLLADWVILATGAVPKALMAADMCERHTPSCVALRGYVKAPALVGRITTLDVVWCPEVRPGYGWIFPAPDGTFNIGVGITDSHSVVNGRGKKKDLNLRKMFDAFVAHYPPAAELMKAGELLGELKGAPLRVTLSGARWSRPGMLATGEAIGSTYSLSGEGIGKAMETAILAAETVLAGRTNGWSEEAVRAQYEHALAGLKPKFELYERANKINAYPWLVDLLIWRAQRSEWLLSRIAGMLNETSNPGNLFTLRGFWRLLRGR
jgi:geranylgeranyl reductase family protein